MPVSDELADRLLRDFQVEASENLDESEQSLLKLGQACDDRAALGELFRRIHSIKGTASYVGLQDIAELAHALESILDAVRGMDAFAFSDALLDVCFETVDALRGMVEKPGSAWDAAALVERLRIEKQRLGVPERAVAASGPLAVAPLAIFLDSAAQHTDTMKLCLERMEKGAGEDRSTLDMFFRAAHSMKSGARYMGFDSLEEAAIHIENILDALRQNEIALSASLLEKLGESFSGIKLFLAGLAQEAAATKEAAPGNAGDPGTDQRSGQLQRQLQPHAAIKTMRVNQQILDVFMNLVGELIVARNVLGHVEKGLERQAGKHLPGLRELRVACQGIARISDAMQRSVMDMRMVPVRTVFQKFPRIIRDITQRSDKKISLILQGEDTEIDKSVAEEIGDPLMHIIRNAADHGIESPEWRVRNGKPERGTILLKAAQEGNAIVIEVVDDGAGIDSAAVLEKAVAKGLVTPDRAATLTREEIIQLIFEPGFSTADQVTAISGRGVGMDVVLTNMRKLKGNVHIDSRVGEGTRLRMELPLTLAVVEVLLVGVGRETFAIPVEAVRETVKINNSRIKPMMKKRAMTLRGEVLGLETLSELLGVLPAEAPSGDDARKDALDDALRDAQDEDIPVVVLQKGEDRLGLAVDALFRQEELVIKPLPDFLAGLPGLAGASILGDGRALLVLDPGELIDSAMHRLEH
ncbi:chemotaxis protein CheA [Megalodesulfovibrio gigas]|uniref:histidine kinase n=1 Tax=Megalodesulfovibrio gigas (strain ATCC 19364 / DSM 1382 / NCIMB 9332 / VKM B-1759) TaxID=1121448 RepID=T2GG42_MEGG1|nr:chemotaxis protein CheA [Megalodesulfovibrio gigas]AGW14947.1 putative chemotaxis protein CheA [Megalodesulfovibrio gigas DSM 1382 = ATCC 19364]